MGCYAGQWRNGGEGRNEDEGRNGGEGGSTPLGTTVRRHVILLSDFSRDQADKRFAGRFSPFLTVFWPTGRTPALRSAPSSECCGELLGTGLTVGPLLLASLCPPTTTHLQTRFLNSQDDPRRTLQRRSK